MQSISVDKLRHRTSMFLLKIQDRDECGKGIGIHWGWGHQTWNSGICSRCSQRPTRVRNSWDITYIEFVWVGCKVIFTSNPTKVKLGLGWVELGLGVLTIFPRVLSLSDTKYLSCVVSIGSDRHRSVTCLGVIGQGRIQAGAELG